MIFDIHVLSLQLVKSASLYRLTAVKTLKVSIILALFSCSTHESYAILHVITNHDTPTKGVISNTSNLKPPNALVGANIIKYSDCQINRLYSTPNTFSKYVQIIKQLIRERLLFASFHRVSTIRRCTLLLKVKIAILLDTYTCCCYSIHFAFHIM